MDNHKTNLTRRQVIAAGTGIIGVGATVMLATNTASPTQAMVSKNALSQPALPVREIEEVFHTRGTSEPNGVFSIDLPRNDLSPILFGIPVKPDIGFDTEITFQATGKEAIIKWEFILLDKEVNPVFSKLFDQDLKPTKANPNALHNHFLESVPIVKFLHGTAIGDPIQIAKALREVLSVTATPFGSSESSSEDTNLPNEEIKRIINGRSMISGGILSISVERRETFRELGINLKPAMQLEAMFNFESIGNGQAAELAEFVLLPGEVDAVIKTLRDNGFNIMALHNHELFITPTTYYMHAFATGKPLDLAHATIKALSHTNSNL